MARIANRGLLGSDSSIVDTEWLLPSDLPVIGPGGVCYPTWPTPPIVGTNGDDFLFGSTSGDTIYGLLGNDWIMANAGNDDVYGDRGSDILQGQQGADRLFGGDDNDTLYGGPDGDLIDGGWGSDMAVYSDATAGVDIDLTAGTAMGGALGDTLVSIENIVGSNYADFIVGTADANYLSGAWGSDYLGGLAGNDQLEGGGGDDVLHGGLGRDVLSGYTENDMLFGEEDDDIIWGGAGNDLVEGGHGADDMYGGDTFGDTGIDTLSYETSEAGVSINLDTGAASGGDAFLDYFVGFENVNGSWHDDVLVGTDGISFSNEIAENVMRGRWGNDQIDGRAGDDTIDGGEGNDTMTGGADEDTFTFVARDRHSHWSLHTPGDDTITDFEVGVDRLMFSDISSLWDLNSRK